MIGAGCVRNTYLINNVYIYIIYIHVYIYIIRICMGFSSNDAIWLKLCHFNRT